MIDGYLQQILAAVSATFFIIGDGMHYGWSAPIVPILKSNYTPIASITDSDIAILETMYLMGGLCSSPFILYSPDQIGRKYSIILATVLNFVSWCLIATISNIHVYFLARFMGGMAANMGYISIPMYLAEVSHQSLRGCFTGFIYFGIIIGIILIYSVGPFLSIAASASVGIVINILALTLFSPMPESPYYLIKKHRLKIAEKSLKFLRGNVDVTEEFKDIQNAVCRQEGEQGRFVDLIKDKGNRKALLIMLIVASAPNFAGMSVVIMNFNEIISHPEGLLSPELSTIICSMAMLFSVIVAISVVDKFGKGNLFGTSAVITGIALILLATYSLLQRNNFQMKTLNWVPLIALLLYAGFIRLGLGFVPMLMNGELYPTKVKAKGMVLGDLFYLISGNITVYLYEYLRLTFGVFVPLYFFALCCVAIAIFSFAYLPETKGKTLEEIQVMLKGGNKENGCVELDILNKPLTDA